MSTECFILRIIKRNQLYDRKITYASSLQLEERTPSRTLEDNCISYRPVKSCASLDNMCKCLTWLFVCAFMRRIDSLFAYGSGQMVGYGVFFNKKRFRFMFFLTTNLLFEIPWAHLPSMIRESSRWKFVSGLSWIHAVDKIFHWL